VPRDNACRKIEVAQASANALIIRHFDHVDAFRDSIFE
jgi:hypothetical protein